MFLLPCVPQRLIRKISSSSNFMAMEAWLMDESDEDQRLPHHRNPKEFVPLSKLEGPDFDFHNTNGKGEGGCSAP
ncbi:Acireductone dioxygenase (Fe(2+)-requiring) protein [Dioscorea alata]|uniref:Acireductone dioxygenase (Fe(2+)-requiring) protein n=1 Tax=Dioscorea alata TaxID=55571 RepID=A0ACB7V1J7_DIOAL|nr:Acireductone dioxygenase (Fe(2+)-requiring) protein [Dioscorea alata]